VTHRRLSERLTRRWRPLPLRTIRLRLTLVYGGLFLVCGAALLGITYGLVSSQYTTSFFIKSGADQVATQVGEVGGALSRSFTASGANPYSAAPAVKLAIGGSSPVAALAFSKCMRANGEPNFPDPIAKGSIWLLHIAAVDPGSPRFVASTQTCGKGQALHVTRSVSVTVHALGTGGGNITVVPSGALRAGLDLNAPSRHYLETAAVGQVNAARGRLLLELGIALAITALIAIGLGWVVAGRALRPLREITARHRRSPRRACTGGSASAVRTMSCAGLATRSTACSNGSTGRSVHSASSPRTYRTSCARRSPTNVR